MIKEELKPIIETIIKDAFKRIEYAYQHQREPIIYIPETVNEERETRTRLIFPRYAKSRKDGKEVETRISEQELRFAFVEAFNAYCETKHIEDLYYSIETPTENRYSGFTSNPQRNDNNGRSGEFDLVIFKKEKNDLKRSCLIEFKANNAGQIDHWKDIIKLKEEGTDKLCYFIEILKSFNDATKKNLEDKKFEGFFKKEEYEKYLNNGIVVNVRCYALEGKMIGQKTEGFGERIDLADLI